MLGPRFSTSCLLLALLAGSVTVPFGALAHQAASGQDYSRFRLPNGQSCCNNQDCRPVRYSLRPDGSVVMFPDGI